VSQAALVADGAMAADVGRLRSAEQRPWRLRTVFVLSLVLAACFVSLPWEELSGQGLPDRDNYAITIEAFAAEGTQQFEIFGTKSQTLSQTLFFTEQLWLELLIFIANTFPDAKDGLLLLSFVATTLAVSQIILRAGLTYAILYLAAPLTIDLFMSQTRSGLALGLLLCALSARRSTLKYLLMLGSVGMHSFAVVLLALYALNAFLLWRTSVSMGTRVLSVLLIGLAAGAVWATLSPYILFALGDRRALQLEFMPVTTGFMVYSSSLLFLLIGFAHIYSDRSNGQHVLFAVALMAMYVCSGALGAGGASTMRFLSLALPFVFVTVSAIPQSAIRKSAVCAIVLFNVIHFSYWMA
jgi:hypothetical protein